jgi:GNAT superfamily N-acetyltransferase
VDVVELSSAQVNEAAAVLARSFQEDPNFTAIHRDPSKRARALPHVFRASIRDALPYGGVLAAVHRGEIVGVAVGLPPGRFPPTARRQAGVARDYLRILGADPLSFWHIMRFGRAAIKLHPREPHWYLEALGVEEGFRGRGIGSRLLAAITTRADQESVGCYLETATERNVPLYASHGFEVLRSGVRLAPDGPPFWLMWRPPQS